MTETVEELIAKYAAAATAASNHVQDDIVSKYAQAALDAKKQKETQKSQKKEALRYRLPDKRLTIELVKQIYSETGISPARKSYFFIDNHPCIQGSFLDEETRKTGTPFGALVIYEAARLSAYPEWVLKPTYRWIMGPIAQLTGYSISYILGFNAAFDGHAPGHRLCSYDFHCGYADGRIIAAILYKENLLSKIESEDPFKEVDDDNDLNELIRVKGYWRDEWGPKPKYLTDTNDLTMERLQELGLSTDIIS